MTMAITVKIIAIFVTFPNIDKNFTIYYWTFYENMI